MLARLFWEILSVTAFTMDSHGTCRLLMLRQSSVTLRYHVCMSGARNRKAS